MSSKNERAGVWVRVSTGGQDEAQQVPAIEAHCDAHRYTIARRYELNDKSASKGEQQAKLDEMLTDMRDGTIKVLVCWRSNRLERRGPEALFRLLRQVKDAGGRIESTTEPMLGTEDLSGEALTALSAVMDRQFSAKLSEDISRAIDGIKASGHVYTGTVPWGFDIEGPKYGKVLVPTDQCRKYLPQILERYTEGVTLRQIAAWLDSEGVKPRHGGKWHEGSVRWIILNRIYVEYGIVRASVWDRANDALKNRKKSGPRSKIDPAMLASLRCARCDDSPMYRQRVRHGDRTRFYYRCTGRGPQRKGCGNMVPLEVVDKLVILWHILSQTVPHLERTWVEGSNWDDEISNIKYTMREAVDSESFDELPALQAKLAELRSRESTPGHYEMTDTGITEAEYFTSLDAGQRREYLAKRDIRVAKGITPEISTEYHGIPLETAGGQKGIRLVIDGVDYGVWPYPPA